MNDITCVQPAGQGVMRPRQLCQQRTFLDFQPWSFFFFLPGPVSRRHSDKMMEAVSFYNEKAQMRPPPKMWKDSRR
ncbi:hypothetical protein ALC56_01241 [Trachymyrmex septentrionalis]|uniref:Uncharacterized protein n=1 Tax=Trachymyrmex septentrionalis TaxID=34720 RepID=A0A151K0X4_9HYME|nr:hypothetical protein ALC56_01241 [Trachymyrmex septentrionalis]